jgi:lactoylglutathione lyase
MTTTTILQTGHIGLNVSQLERSREFYKTVFGLEVAGQSLREGRRYVFLSSGERLVLTLWEQSQGQFETAKPGLHHLSFQVDTLEEVRQAEQRLHSLGATLLYDGIVPHSEGASSGGIFFEDPDGIRLEIYAPSGVSGKAAPVADGPSCGFF